MSTKKHDVPEELLASLLADYKKPEDLTDESTILRFRHMLEALNLSIQILATVNGMLTAKGLLLK